MRLNVGAAQMKKSNRDIRHVVILTNLPYAYNSAPLGKATKKQSTFSLIEGNATEHTKLMPSYLVGLCGVSETDCTVLKRS